MKKMLVAMMVFVLVAGVLAVPAQAAQKYQKSDLTSLILSGTMPGVGEWYNSDFQGGFPIAECIVGAICPCVQFSSMIDAVAGDTSNGEMRFDFWGAPKR